MTIEGYRRLALAALCTACVLVVLGGAICFLGAAKSVPDWPTTFGGITPPAAIGPLVEYLHRIFAVLTGLLVLACAVVGLRRYRSRPWLGLPPVAAVPLLVLVAILGAIAVLGSLSPVVATVDLGSALLVVALMTVTVVSARIAGRDERHPWVLAFSTASARMALVAFAGTFVVLASGLAAGVPGSPVTCLGLPAWETAGHLRAGWLRSAQFLLSAATGTLVVGLAVVAWVRQRSRLSTLSLSTLAAVLFIADAVTSERSVARGFPPLLLTLRVATAAALWVVIVALAARHGLGAANDSDRAPVTRVPASGGRRIVDLFTMTRPLVTGLLLAAAYAGMIATAGTVPKLHTTLWTLVGVALAAAGAQAINAYLDRDMDASMSRTSRRPLPAGRLTPAEGLALGLAACVSSLYILAELVSWQAAAWTILGVGWYALLYTRLLKRSTPYSIVIGGIAGALMPIVGGAAVGAGVSLPAALLGLVVFLWTPPHFWSLATVHAADYLSAGVPVFPAVRGGDRTQRSIVVYSAAAVAASAALAFSLRGWGILLPSAAVLGAVLLWSAVAMGRNGARSAQRLYLVSELYLALLLVATAVQVLA